MNVDIKSINSIRKELLGSASAYFLKYQELIEEDHFEPLFSIVECDFYDRLRDPSQ